MTVEQVARCTWNARPDKRGLGGRMAWNPQAQLNSRDEKFYDTRLLRLLRTNRFTGFKLAKISVPRQNELFSRLGLRQKFAKSLQWEGASKADTVNALRQDVQQFLAFYGKPADYWPEFV